MQLYIALVVGIYLLTIVETLTGALPFWSLLTFLSLPLIIKLIQRFLQEPDIPPDADPQTAQTGMVYGILLIVSLLLALLF
jgi:1,4-dihydroxy-2-naphthoate octaprenyltransferase